MGDVAVTLKVMPEDKEIDLNEIGGEIESLYDPREIDEEEVAFGLKALKVLVVVPEDAGGSDELQESIQEIEGVKSVQVTDQRKLL
ncbi:MAG: elongation factor 1-beta [Candidatus Hadarchaeota archaeon]